MVFGFVGGVIAGAGLLKLYQLHDSEEDEPSGARTKITASRATMLNQNSNYNEDADDTSATHINFLSDVVARLWPYMGKAIAATVKESVEPSFKETLPGPLATLKFVKLDLGDVPLVIDNILVRELQTVDDEGKAYGSDQRYLQFEWDITWQSDCDIQLATDKVAGLAAISFGVKTLTLSGRLQVIAKPLTSAALPCIDAVQFAFVNPPKIELDFTGLANLADMKLSFGGVNVVDIKGIVRGIVDDILSTTMVLPTRIYVPLGVDVDFRDIYAPQYKGMARVRLHSGRGFQIQKASSRFGSDDIPDVYVKMRVGVEPYFKSSVCKDNCNPVWDPDEEFSDFLVCAYRDQILEIQVWDEDTGVVDTDDHLGYAYVTLGQVLLEADRNGLFEIELMREGKRGCNEEPTGQFVTISLQKVPLTTKDLSSMSRMAVTQYSSTKDYSKLTAKQIKKHEKRDKHRVVGLATILVSHATNLPFNTEAEANTFVKVYTGCGPGKKEIGFTPPIPGSLNPQYMTPICVPMTVAYMRERFNSPGTECFCMEVYQQDIAMKHKPELLGDVVVNKSEVKVGDEWSLRETRSINRKYPNTELAFTISYQGVSTLIPKHYQGPKQAVSRGISYDTVSSISEGGEIEMVENKIRIRIVKGYGFPERKKRLSRKTDIPDVYCLIKYGSSPVVWRTATIKDDETPEWEDEFRDYTMMSMNEVISIDVWDENSKTDDYFYGNARTSVAKVLMNSGKLDVAIKPGEGKSKKKSMAENAMFITIECQKL